MLNKEDIVKYLELIFNKPFEKIKKEEFLNMTTITLEFKDTLDGNNQIGLLQVFKLLPNLKNITLRNKIITNDLINELAKLKLVVLSFEKCSIRSDVSLNNFEYLQELNILNCSLLDYSILNTINSQITKISIVKPNDESMVDVNYFIKYSSLKELYLEKCVIQNVKDVSKLQNLKILSLLWSEIDDIEEISVLLSLKNLEEIYLSNCYENLEGVKKLSLQKKVYFDLNHFVFEN